MGFSCLVLCLLSILVFVQYIFLSRGQIIFLHIYVSFKTWEGGWGHPSWPCPCLAINLPWSLFPLGLYLRN